MASAGLVPYASVRLYSPRLEKRSQALQACNLTRNIQADGAPMVHHPWGIKPPGVFFCHHRTPESCLGKRTGIVAQDVSLQLRFGLSSAAIAFSSVAGRSCRPCTYWGLSRGRSMKIKERSENRSRFIQSMGTPRCGSMHCEGTPLRTLISHRPRRDT